MVTHSSTILDHLVALYGEEMGKATYQRLRPLMDRYASLFRAGRYMHNLPQPAHTPQAVLSEGDALLITYANQLQEPGIPPLQTLANFCERRLAGLVSGLHILPFFPFSSDDGFSVIDYRRVDPHLGTWADITSSRRYFHLMFDAVINHTSVQSEWFQGFLQDSPKYSQYYISVEGDPDLSRVVRPRALPLLTRFNTASGPKQVWTTFSPDQVDLNYRNPDVLLEIMDILLTYVTYGAVIIRLDAIAYLWKEAGTSCIHLPQTHRIIQLLRAVLNSLAAHVLLITETNVSHQENLAYFGNGTNEAQMVYNFALPPLVLHAFSTGSARKLSSWAATLELPSTTTTFFNFLASHDGIGLNPARGILSDEEINELVQLATDHRGRVSYKQNSDGSSSPYELNINYFDALNNPSIPEQLPLQVSRFLTAHAIMLSLVGVPGIYFHSLFGSRGWQKGVELTGRYRTINRQKLLRAELDSALEHPDSLPSQVFYGFTRLLKARAASSAFHPHATQRILKSGEAIFAVLRASPDNSQRVLCLHNVSSKPQYFTLDWNTIFPSSSISLKDLITERRIDLKTNTLDLMPYQQLWLAPEV